MGPPYVTLDSTPLYHIPDLTTPLTHPTQCRHDSSHPASLGSSSRAGRPPLPSPALPPNPRPLLLGGVLAPKPRLPDGAGSPSSRPWRAQRQQAALTPLCAPPPPFPSAPSPIPTHPLLPPLAATDPAATRLISAPNSPCTPPLTWRQAPNGIHLSRCRPTHHRSLLLAIFMTCVSDTTAPSLIKCCPWKGAIR